MDLLSFDILQSGLTILLLLTAGELLGRLTRGVVPGILLAGLLFIAGCWSGILPADLAGLAGTTSLAPIAILMTIVNMGSTMSLRQFAANWRVVVLAAGTYLGQLAAVFLVIGLTYGLNTAVSGIPGGMAAALIVQERGRALGYDELVVLSVLLLTTQALIGCPVSAVCIRREARRLQNNSAALAEAEEVCPVRRRTDMQYGPLLRLYAAAWLASRLEMLTGLSRYVLALLLGLLLSQIGLLDKNELAASKSDGFLFFLLMCTVISSFGAATPDMFRHMLPPLLLTLAVSTCGAVLTASLLGRLLHFSTAMSIALGMNIMIGFPMNLLISQEIIEGITQNTAERQALMHQISTKMVLGGMVTTTFLATAAAGLLSPLMVQ